MVAGVRFGPPPRLGPDAGFVDLFGCGVVVVRPGLVKGKGDVPPPPPPAAAAAAAAER